MMVKHHHRGYDELRRVIPGYGVGLGGHLAETDRHRARDEISRGEVAREIDTSRTHFRISVFGPGRGERTRTEAWRIARRTKQAVFRPRPGKPDA
jgi:hypothetical protein